MLWDVQSIQKSIKALHIHDKFCLWPCLVSSFFPPMSLHSPINESVAEKFKRKCAFQPCFRNHSKRISAGKKFLRWYQSSPQAHLPRSWFTLSNENHPPFLISLSALSLISPPRLHDDYCTPLPLNQYTRPSAFSIFNSQIAEYTLKDT